MNHSANTIDYTDLLVSISMLMFCPQETIKWRGKWKTCKCISTYDMKKNKFHKMKAKNSAGLGCYVSYPLYNNHGMTLG